MIKVNILRRILYTGAGLVLLVAALLTLLVIPYIILDKSPNAAPGAAAVGTLVTVILHLLILNSIRKAIITHKQNGHLKNVVFIVSGIGLLFLGLFVMDGAIQFLEHDNMRLASISMFICVGCDFFAAVLAFTALLLLSKKTDIK